MGEPEVLSSGPHPDQAPGHDRRIVHPVLPIVVLGLLFGLTCGYAGYQVGRGNRLQEADDKAGRPGIRLVAADWFGDRQDPPLDQVIVQLNITNRGSRRVDVLSAGTSYPGLTLSRTDFLVTSGVSRNVPSPPFGLDPDTTVGVLLTYWVTDCAKATSGRLPLPIRILDRGKPSSVDVGTPRTYAGAWQSGFLSSMCPAAGGG